MIATIPSIIMKYRKFNSEYFDNELPNNIKFSLCNVTSFYGQFRVNKSHEMELRINKNIDFKSEETLENTIIHEMIHVCQWVKYKDVNHGKTFKIWSDIIYSKSNCKYKITRTSSFEEKGFVINEKVRKTRQSRNEDEEIFVLIYKNLHRVFRNAKVEDLINIANYNSGMKIYKYYGTFFNGEKSGSTFTRTFKMYSNKNDEEDVLNRVGTRIY